MKPWIRNSLIAAGCMLVALSAAYYWLFVESHRPSQSQFALDIAQVRRLAAGASGDKPISVEVERVALFRFPATAVVAGDGWQMRDLPVYSYRIAYPQTSITSAPTFELPQIAPWQARRPIRAATFPNDTT
jgi:hypothetical protein